MIGVLVCRWSAEAAEEADLVDFVEAEADLVFVDVQAEAEAEADIILYVDIYYNRTDNTTQWAVIYAHCEYLLFEPGCDTFMMVDMIAWI